MDFTNTLTTVAVNYDVFQQHTIIAPSRALCFAAYFNMPGTKTSNIFGEGLVLPQRFSQFKEETAKNKHETKDCLDY